jgi:8-oxo-dGTP diphosphatase
MVYKIKFDQFFSYSFSMDCLIFGFSNGKIHILLVKRAMEPYGGYWAIPGDLVYPDEDLPHAAERILEELTELKNVVLRQGGVFGKPNRHPQGRVITNAYLAMVRMNETNPQPSSWVEELRWVPVDEVESLAFDHNEILTATYQRLKERFIHEPICFEMLPLKFTLNELQQLYEYAFGICIDKPNFRKRIKNLPLTELKERQENVKHRPATLYSFDWEKYKTLVKEGRFEFNMWL